MEHRPALLDDRVYNVTEYIHVHRHARNMCCAGLSGGTMKAGRVADPRGSQRDETKSGPLSRPARTQLAQASASDVIGGVDARSRGVDAPRRRHAHDQLRTAAKAVQHRVEPPCFPFDAVSRPRHGTASQWKMRHGPPPSIRKAIADLV